MQTAADLKHPIHANCLAAYNLSGNEVNVLADVHAPVKGGLDHNDVEASALEDASITSELLNPEEGRPMEGAEDDHDVLDQGALCVPW